MSTLLDNRYQIIRVLGSGGFGETFLAEDTKMPSSPYCVIKQLRPIADKPEVYQLVQQRFGREAAVLEELGASCNQIPCLFANFIENEQFFLVQEWIEGPTLLQKVKAEGKQSEQFTRQLLIEVLHILDYVHSRGMIHRDIKPDNIILRDSDRLPVLIDFGAVKETVSNPANAKHQPAKSIIVGTPGFMASEQSVGRPIFASDLYGLGMTAIYLLTGKLPRDLTTDPHTAEILWREHAGDLSESLAQVLEKAVHFYPRDRYANAKEMLHAIERGSSSQPSKPRFLAGTPNTPSKLKRKRKAAIAGFLILGTLAGSGMALGLPLIRNFYQSQTKAQPDIPAKQNSPVAVKPNSFYFLADTTYEDAGTAELYVEVLKANGFNQAGVFKLSDYPNLKGGTKVQVYVAKFDRMSSCVAQLKIYASQKPDAFCALASSDVSKSTEQVLGSTVLATQQPKQPEPKPVVLATTTPEQAVREYYGLINNRSYETAWQKLSPSYQQSRAKNGFKNSYLAWWEEVDRVEINQASLISRGADRAKVNAELTYYKKNGDIIPESLQVFLVWDNSHGWIFDDTRVR
jgi:serine/threonine protein kinase, bacterial